MATDIRTPTARKALAPRREPYWSRVSTGLYLGYRVLDSGAGTWIGRRRNETGKQEYRAVGVFEDAQPKPGAKREKSAYERAEAEVRAWAEQLDQGAPNKVVTVGDACTAYVSHLRTHKSAKAADDAAGRFDRLILDPKGELADHRIGSVALEKLRADTLRKWLNAQVPEDSDGEDIRRAKDTANRNWTSLRAALNHALKDGLTTTAPWKAIKPFPDVSRGREHFLASDELDRLLGCMPDDLRLFAQGLLLTAARPGELAAAQVQDFDGGQGTLTLAGKVGRRTAPLSSAAAVFLKERARGRIGQALLFEQADGSPWHKGDWRVFKDAAQAAGLPGDVVTYSLRHTAISRLIAGGMDSFVVAKVAGTSTAMIDRHYGHLRTDRTRAMLDAALALQAGGKL